MANNYSQESIRNEYFDKIMNMTLNTKIEDIIDILNYVNNNKVFEEDFFSNLYVLVEKEKYLKGRFNAEKKLFPRLDEKFKSILEKRFIERLNNYNNEEKMQIIDDYKKYGYENVIDKKYQDFFDSCEFENDPTFDLDEGKLSTYSLDFGSKWTVVTVVANASERLFAREYNVKGKSHSLYDIHERDDTDADYFYAQCSSEMDFLPVRRYAINKETGECIRIPKRKFAYFPRYALGYFISTRRKDENSPWISKFYNKKFKKILTIENIDVLVDYRLGLFLVFKTDKTIEVYDKDLKQVRTLNFSFPYGNIDIGSVNGGVIALKSQTLNKMVYFDYINMREIDSFKYGGQYGSHFGYSDGIYNYKDTNGKYGYKHINGEVLIEPIFSYAGPFLGNIAVAKIKDGNKDIDVIVDRTGKYVTCKEFFKKLCDRLISKYKKSELFGAWIYYSYMEDSWDRIYFTQDFKKEQYQIIYHPKYDWDRYSKGYVTVEDNYIVKSCLPIVDIIIDLDFDIKKNK